MVANIVAIVAVAGLTYCTLMAVSEIAGMIADRNAERRNGGRPSKR